MNWNRGIWYFLYAIVFLFAFYLIQEGNAYLYHQAARTFNILYPNLIQLLLVLLGIILGLEHFIAEWKKEGCWRGNFWRIIFLSLPMAYFAFSMLISMTFKIPIPSLFMYRDTGTITAVLFGYFIITSFYRNG